MSRTLVRALVLPLLVAECVARFVTGDEQLTALFAVLVIGVCAVGWVLKVGP